MLVLWVLFSIGLIAWLVKRQGWNAETRSHLPLLLVIGLVIGFILPKIGGADGLPIRGYGVMLLLATVCGVTLAAYEGRRMGLHPDIIFGLAFWMFIFGIAGARLFYVIQYWKNFQGASFFQTVLAAVNMTQGGLVVYGSLIGGLAAAAYYLRKNKLPMLAVGDLIVPGMLVGLALGRIGCLANGCCYGGLCPESPFGAEFPVGSPPYVDQLVDGQLLGMKTELVDDESRWRRVTDISPNTVAAEVGLKVDEEVRIGLAVPDEQLSKLAESNDARQAAVTIERRSHKVALSAEQLPPTSLMVYPAQIFSAVNAALFAFLMWAYYPFRRRDGEPLAILLTLYPVMRFVLEWIRNDEPGRFGTSFTISQWISVGILLIAFGLWSYILRRPRGSVLPMDQNRKHGSPDAATV